MVDFNATEPRIALMRSIAAGELNANRDGAQVLQIWRGTALVTGRRLAIRVGNLIQAGLVRPIPLFAADRRPLQLTEAGLAWLALYGEAA